MSTNQNTEAVERVLRRKYRRGDYIHVEDVVKGVYQDDIAVTSREVYDALKALMNADLVEFSLNGGYTMKGERK